MFPQLLTKAFYEEVITAAGKRGVQPLEDPYSLQKRPLVPFQEHAENAEGG